MSAHNLLDELPKAGAILFALEHFAEDGDLAVERRFRVEEHLKLNHEHLKATSTGVQTANNSKKTNLAFFANLANLRVTIGERRLVVALIVFELEVELFEALFEDGILQQDAHKTSLQLLVCTPIATYAALQIGEFAAQIAELRAKAFDFVCGVGLLDVVA